MHFPSYSTERIVSDADVTLHYHYTSGFLGVYGNIALCTFLHGAVMCQLVDSLDSANIAGDDGAIDTTDHRETLKAIPVLGIIEASKCFNTLEEASIHLKRPLRQIGNRLHQGYMVIWPSFEYLFCLEDCDARYPYLEDLTITECRGAMASSITTFLSSLINIELSVEHISLIDSLLVYIYQTLDLPLDGCVPQVTHNPIGFVPAYRTEFIGLDPIRNTILRHYPGRCVLPARGFQEADMTELESSGEMRSNGNALLRYLEILGVVDPRKVDEVFYGEVGLERLLKEYLDPDPIIYHYTRCLPFPSWIYDFPNT
jgi:hypothetical protein